MTELLPLRQNTLDDLWQEAETLGNLHVRTSAEGWDSTGKRSGYDVTLNCLKGRTKLKIETKHPSLLCAVADAINEARTMGVGEAP